MTVASATSSVSYTGNGSTTAFAIPFYFLQNTDVVVQMIAADGTTTTAVLDSDYTLTGAGNEAGGTATFGTAPANGVDVYITRVVTIDQETAYPQDTPFPAASHEQALDKLTMIAQQLQRANNASLTLQTSDVVAGVSAQLPAYLAGSLIGWDATTKKLVNTGGSGFGSGTIADVNISATAAISATKINFTQPATNFWFKQNGAVVNRFNDRVFVGGATESSGDLPQTTDDWLSAFYNNSGYTGSSTSGQLAVLTNDNAGAGAAIMGGSRTLNFESAGTSSFGGQFVSVNDHASLATNAWAIYAEAHKVTSASGSSYGMELDTRTLFAEGQPDPFAQASVVAAQLASGAGLASAGQFDAGAAIQIEANPMKFKVGINFGSTSITGADGTGGANVGIAMALGPGHTIQWYGATGVPTGSIVTGATSGANATGINFSGAGFQIRQLSDGAPLFYAFPVASAVNYIAVEPAATAGAPSVRAGGTDTNIDLLLVPQGTGNVRFGTYTASAPSATGYITIKDSSGATRKLLCA